MTPFDDELRRRLGAAVRLTGVAPQALDGLRPRMRRARRVRRALLSATVVAVVGSGTAAGLQIVRLSHPQRSMTPTDSAGVTLPSVIGTEVDVDATDSSGPTQSVETQPSITDPTVTETTPVADTLEPTTANSGVTIPPPTGPSPTTSATQTVRLESACGAVVVDVVGDTTTFVRAEPIEGFEIDVKNDGPEQVEIGFAGGGNECEVKAWVQEGTFRQFVDNHGQ